MRRLFAATSALAVAGIGLAQAAPCNIIGTWTDSYGISGTFTSEKAGTATDKQYCPNTYAIKVTLLTGTKWNLVGRASGCPTVTAKLTFAKGSCTKASGTVTVDGFTLSDTWTKTGAASRHEDTSALTKGFRD